MIIVKLKGRFGNQLFQYAFSYSLSKKLKTYCIIDSEQTEDKIKKYFKVDRYLGNESIKSLFKLFVGTDWPVIKQNGEEIPGYTLPINKNSIYDGYFQSEHFFKEVKSLITKRFLIKENYKDDFLKKYGYLFKRKKVLAIHYRLTDYLTWGSEKYGGVDLSLPDKYYINALKQIPSIDEYKVIIVTDDKEEVLKRLPHFKDKTIISDEEIMDFQALMNADKLIISNSTFAWWAAYLNIKQAQVFAPEYWIGFKIKKEIPIGIIPDHFIKVSF